MKKIFIVFTAEHASHAIALEYQHLFIGKEKLLSSHRGFDAGTKEIASFLAKSFKTRAFYGKYSRLLIDLNRSSHHPTAFSKLCQKLIPGQKQKIISTIHDPHYEAIQKLIAAKIKLGFSVFHIGVHSFTPVLKKVVRTAQIGLLYDPRRAGEKILAEKWQQALRAGSNFVVRRNYPYLGKLDGLTTRLRKEFSSENYIGLELEVNQSLVKNSIGLLKLNNLLAQSLKSALKY